MKAAIWALGHIGLSSDGVNFLHNEDVISSIASLAAENPIYSVRGTCFHALSLIATTLDGANLLAKNG